MSAPLDVALLKRNFDRDGFVVIRQYLSGLELQELSDHADKVMDGHVYSHGFKGVRKDLDKVDDWFKEKLERGPHVPVIAAMILEKPVPASASFFDKPIMESVEIRQHVDGLGKQDGATLWIALDTADRTNGCLCYVRGSHHQKHSEEALHAFNEDAEDAVIVEAQPGDAIIHSARTVHWSRKSCSTNCRRRAVSFFYWASSTANAGIPQKQVQSAKNGSSDITLDFDAHKAETALQALDRAWAQHPAIVKMFWDNPKKFMYGLREKDPEAFEFIWSRARNNEVEPCNSVKFVDKYVPRSPCASITVALSVGVMVGIVSMRALNWARL